VSLTTRVVVRSLVVMAVVIGGVVLLTRELVRVSGRADVDRVLREEATMLGEAFGDQLPSAAGLDGVLSAPEAEHAARRALTVRPSSASHVALLTVGGVRLQAAGGPARVAAMLRGSEAPGSDPGRIRSLDTVAGPVRVLDTTVIDDTGAAVATVTVAAPLEQPRDTAASVLRRAALAGAIGIAVGGLALWLVVRKSLRPLRQVSAAAESIAPTDLTARVPVPATDDEVAELATGLNEMLDRIETADENRRRYLAAISHEVRTPLAVAEGHLELLGTDDAAVVRHELERLRRVLDDLMAVARGSDEIDVQREAVFLPDLFDAVRTRVAALPYATAVTLDSPPPAVLLGDQARLEQCVANLVANAIDHNPSGTEVTLTARADETSVALTVADNGTGIDPAVLPHVFEPFTTTRTDGRGRTSGLGLAVVHALVEAQGGTTHVDSGPTGTRATITLPRATA
jgi:signal transduction histidine kinase